MDPELIKQLLEGTAGNYGQGIGDLIPYLLPMIGGLPLKKQKDTVGVEQQQYNLLQDQFQVMTDPLIRVLLGTYTPTVQEAPTPAPFEPNMPRTKAYLASNNKWSEVAQGIMSGDLDPLSAQELIRTDPNVGENSGHPYDAQQVQAQITAMFDEVAKNNAAQADYEAKVAQQKADFQATQQKNDPFAKAGLPSPFEHYTADTAPLDAATASRFAMENQTDQQAVDATAGLRGTPYAPPPLDMSNPTRANANFIDISTGKPTAGQYPDPRDEAVQKAVALRDLGRQNQYGPMADKANQRQAADQAFQENFKKAYAEGLDARGRTPLKDNLSATILPLLLMKYMRG